MSCCPLCQHSTGRRQRQQEGWRERHDAAASAAQQGLALAAIWAAARSASVMPQHSRQGWGPTSSRALVLPHPAQHRYQAQQAQHRRLPFLLSQGHSPHLLRRQMPPSWRPRWPAASWARCRETPAWEPTWRCSPGCQQPSSPSMPTSSKLSLGQQACCLTTSAARWCSWGGGHGAGARGGGAVREALCSTSL